jgi:uncharacterized SAM-binding protein YcdF (DUF218 family)
VHADTNHPMPEAVIALSSGFMTDTMLDDEGSGRLAAAANEASRHGVPLYTTRVISESGATSDSAQARLLKSLGFIGRWRILDGVVFTTRDEAVALRRSLPESTKVEVVTTDLHTRRSCSAFSAVGLLARCDTQYEGPRSLRRGFEVWYEILAMLKYHAWGWAR